MLLGDPFPKGSTYHPGASFRVKPGTALQIRNETDVEAVLFAYGAPPVVGEAEFLEDVVEL